MCSNAKTFLAFSPQEDGVRTRLIASDSPLGVKFWRLIFILLYCSAFVSIYIRRISFPFIALLIIFIDYIITVTSTPVTTPYLYSLSVLYSYSLMKVAVKSLKRLNYC